MSDDSIFTPIISGSGRIWRFSINTLGRDLIFSDMHGEVSLLELALEQANVDPEKDRVFFGGDGIDRGGESHRYVDVLEKCITGAVRGNHEDALSELYQHGEPDISALAFMVQRNGFAWWLTASQEVQERTLGAVRNLPLVIEIETLRGTVGIVHGDVPSHTTWQEFLNLIEGGDRAAIHTCLWGRERIENGDENGVEGVGRVFVGHTPQWNGLTRLGNVYAIDTGAVFGVQGLADEGRLTLANIAMQTAPLVTKRASPGLIDLRDENVATNTPFGSYAKVLRRKM